MRALVLISLISISGAASAGDWERTDTYMLGGALGLLAVDWGQTHDLARQYTEAYGTPACADPATRGISLAGPCPTTRAYAHTELNPLLPKNPTSAEVDKYFALAMLGTAGLAYALPARYRRPFLGTVIVLESLVVLHNHRIGLRVSF